MAQPLSPLSSAGLNTKKSATPGTSTRTKDQRTIDQQLSASSNIYTRPFGYVDEACEVAYQKDAEDPPSSPFVADPVRRNTLSPRKHQSPPKPQSPVKLELMGQGLSPGTQRKMLHDDPGLARAIDMLEADDSVIHHHGDHGDETIATMGDESGFAGMDDTAFSTFSAVPNADMTLFAKLGQAKEAATPIAQPRGTPRSDYRARASKNVSCSLS